MERGLNLEQGPVLAPHNQYRRGVLCSVPRLLFLHLEVLPSNQEPQDGQVHGEARRAPAPNVQSNDDTHRG